MDTKIFGAITNAPDATDDDYVVGTRAAGGSYTDYKYTMAQIAAYIGTTTPSVVASGRETAETAAVATVVTHTVGASDTSFEISANANVTTSSAENFLVDVAYTDETNTARTVNIKFMYGASGTISSAIVAANGAVPYLGLPMRIRCKAATAITVSTSGTFTGCTYNVEAAIIQMA